MSVNRTLSTIWQLAAACLLLAAFAGCQSPLFSFRGQSPDKDEFAPEYEELDEGVQLVRDLTIPTGMSYLKLESVGLVIGLDGTGSDPPKDHRRQTLIDEMKTHEVESPNQILASEATSLVMLRVFLPPGCRKGDRVDVDVSLPRGSRTTSIKNGWLMQSRLREYAVLGNALHTGRVNGLAQGEVLVDAELIDSDDPKLVKHGRVLGGGRSLVNRTVGLALREEHAALRTSALIGTLINDRFHYYDAGIKKGVANPKNNQFIELEIPIRYRNNLDRYMRVIQSLAVGESPTQRAERMETLAAMLLEPSSAATAALQLEAIGTEAIPLLKPALQSMDPEVRFYAAEALAYLDDSEAAVALAMAAKQDRAFRWHALTALSTMDHVAAYDALADLLADSSAETRFGAFRAMLARNPRDPFIRGEHLGDKFYYHHVATAGEPLVHFSTTRKRQLVVFGADIELKPPAFLFAGKQIMLKGTPDGRIKVTRFIPGDDDEEVTCSTSLDDVIRSIAEVGGGYAEVYEALRDAKQNGELSARLVLDAHARSDRIYRRQSQRAPADSEGSDDEPIGSATLPDSAERDDDHGFSGGGEAATPVPGLFAEPDLEDPGTTNAQLPEIDGPEAPTRPGFFGKMKGWFRRDKDQGGTS